MIKNSSAFSTMINMLCMNKYVSNFPLLEIPFHSSSVVQVIVLGDSCSSSGARSTKLHYAVVHSVSLQ